MRENYANNFHMHLTHFLTFIMPRPVQLVWLVGGEVEIHQQSEERKKRLPTLLLLLNRRVSYY